MTILWRLDRAIGRLACMIERHDWQPCEFGWGTCRQCSRCGAIR